MALGYSAWTAVHHAFTSPKAESMDTFDTEPVLALAYAYDIVCNGNELGGGSPPGVSHPNSRYRSRGD